MYDETLYLAHHGVKGMKWGVRRKRDTASSYRSAMDKIAKLDAKSDKKANQATRTIFGRSRDAKIAKYDKKAAKAKMKLNRAMYKGRVKSADDKVRRETQVAKWEYKSAVQQRRKDKQLARNARYENKARKIASRLNKELATKKLKDVGYKKMSDVPAKDRELGKKYVVDIVYR